MPCIQLDINIRRGSYFSRNTIAPKSNLLVLILVLMISINVNCQTNENINTTIKKHEVWIDIYPHFYINEKLEYYGDAGYRTVLSEHSWNRIYIRPSVRYHLNKNWELHAGLGLFYIYYHEKALNRFEITPWQGVQLNWPRTQIIRFNHLIKLEERISFLTKDGFLSFEFRLRYKLGGKLNFSTNNSLHNWFVPFYGELFFSAFDEIEEFFSNKRRGGIGLGYSKSDWSIQLLYNWQLVRVNPTANLDYTNNAIQLKLKKVWSKKNNKS